VTTLPLSWLVGAAALAGGALVGLLVTLVARRRRSPWARLRRVAWDQIADVVIPDDVDGEIHLDLALLTPLGILVLEIRHLSGTLFWGDQLDSWTVLDGKRRKVIPNPLPGIQARRLAVQALAPGAPVEGVLLLIGPVEIAGDIPPGVVRPEELVMRIPACGRKPPPTELGEAWAQLKRAARPF
jgi:hypothetical protein